MGPLQWRVSLQNGAKVWDRRLFEGQGGKRRRARGVKSLVQHDARRWAGENRRSGITTGLVGHERCDRATRRLTDAGRLRRSLWRRLRRRRHWTGGGGHGGGGWPRLRAGCVAQKRLEKSAQQAGPLALAPVACGGGAQRACLSTGRLSRSSSKYRILVIRKNLVPVGGGQNMNERLARPGDRDQRCNAPLWLVWPH